MNDTFFLKMNNRKTKPLPKEPCQMIIQDNNDELRCGYWRPATKKQKIKCEPGYLGTFYTPSELSSGTIGFNAWEQNHSEFVFWITLEELINNNHGETQQVVSSTV